MKVLPSSLKAMTIFLGRDDFWEPDWNSVCIPQAPFLSSGSSVQRCPNFRAAFPRGKVFPFLYSSRMLWLLAAASFSLLIFVFLQVPSGLLYHTKYRCWINSLVFNKGAFVWGWLYKMPAGKLHGPPLRLLCLSEMEAFHANSCPFCLLLSMLMILHWDYF